MAGPGAQPLYIREAELLGHNGIGCEHLLLGMLADEAGLAARVLTAHGLTLDHARRRIAEICSGGWQEARRWTHSPRATVTHKLAEIEAERLDHHQPNDGHLLLAMITEGGGVPNVLFAEASIDLPRLREDLLDALEVSDQARETYLRQRTATERARHRRARQQRPHDA